MTSGVTIVGANFTHGAFRDSDNVGIVVNVKSDEIRPNTACGKEEQS